MHSTVVSTIATSDCGLHEHPNLFPVHDEAWRTLFDVLVTSRLLIGWKFHIQVEPTASPWLQICQDEVTAFETEF